MNDFEQNLKLKEIVLPELQSKNKNFPALAMVKQTGNLLFLSGNGPLDANGNPLITGKLGTNLTIEEGYEAARLCGLNLLSRLKTHLGDLNEVNQIVKVLGLVASSDDFYDQPKVMNGFSDLMLEVFGDEGEHARSAMGTNVLPSNIPVEVEMVVEIKQN